MFLRGLFKTFSIYTLIGIGNTAVHWAVFGVLFALCGLTQAVSNTVAFLVAVTVSYFLNARFTFKVQPRGIRYLLFVVFMGFFSYATGWVGDWLALPAVITLIAFSAISLVLGFIYSKLVVFRQ